MSFDSDPKGLRYLFVVSNYISSMTSDTEELVFKIACHFMCLSASPVLSVNGIVFLLFSTRAVPSITLVRYIVGKFFCLL